MKVSGSAYAIEAVHLIKRFGTRKALDDVSFCLPQGSFLSVFGPNGAGKTTLIKTLSLLGSASEGAVKIFGKDTADEPEAVRGSLGVLSHEPMLYPDLTAEENLIFFAKLYGVENPKARVDELLGLVGLKHRKLDTVRGFSRGMSQRLAIARALVNDPKILFLDEPYSGLDPHAVAVFDDLLTEVREDRTFVMVSHDMDKGLQLCTHAMVMSKGRIASYQSRTQVNVEEFRCQYLDIVGMGVS